MCIVYDRLIVFFFQAEDGIRDLVRSRGLGDVYKRQAFTCNENGSNGFVVPCFVKCRLELQCHLTIETIEFFRTVQYNPCNIILYGVQNISSHEMNDICFFEILI